MNLLIVITGVEAIKKLENKEIDLLAPAQFTDLLRAKFDYAKIYLGTEAAAIYTHSDSQILYEDFNSMNKLTYGVAVPSTFAKVFVEKYTKAHKIAPKLKFYANTTELSAALASNEVDAIVTNIMFASSKYKLLGWFSLLPIYYISQKGNEEILDPLDLAMMKILANNPAYIAELESKYFPVYSNQEMTYEEIKFAKKNLDGFTIALQDNFYPLSDWDPKDDKFKGISADILEKIADYLDVKFNYVVIPSDEYTHSYLSEHHIDALANVDFNDANREEPNYLLTTPYLNFDKVVVAKKTTIFSKDSPITVGLPVTNASMGKVIKKDYPNFNIKVFETINDCLGAVLEDDVDAVVLNRHIVDRAIEKPKYSNLNVNLMTEVRKNLSIALLNPLEDPAKADKIRTIFDKAIKSIDRDVLNQVVIENTTNYHYVFTVFDFIYKYQLLIAVFLVLTTICFFLLLRARNIEAEKNKDLDIKNKQLGDAVGLAQRASVAKSQFLSRMSHEIRTPMNAIVGLTAIGKMHTHEPERIEDYLTKIDLSSKLLLNIINDVLDMSAIESEKLKIAHDKFNIRELLTSLSNIYYAQCRTKNVHFEMVTSEIIHENLVGDGLRVNQILMNLLSNAYKFTPEHGEITVTVTETTANVGQVFLRFIVKDSGIGMSKEMLTRLFKPFEQESANTAKQFGGSGLGLSIAKNLVEMMHGVIQVDSIQGQGTVFTVDMPFDKGQDTHTITKEELKDIHALVVDDDEASLEYTALVLSRIGVRFDTAKSGDEAIKLLEQSYDNDDGYDVCLLDWKMPGLSGIDITKKIREEFDPDTVIIIVSAYDVSECHDEATSAGANYFVTKPLFQSTVFNLMMKLSGGKYIERSAKPNSYDFSGHKVLLAEDNELNREIALELLKMVHMETDYAVNGQEAIDKFVASDVGAYDIILMDIQMPIKDGLQAAREIRTLDRKDAKSVPIYAMTANAFNEDVADAIASGMNGHIAKPIDTEIMYQTIKKALE